MKAKVGRGNGFRGAMNYVMDEGQDRTGNKNPEIVGGTLSARNAADAAREFSVTRSLRPDTKNPVWHCSLSLPADERLTADAWRSVTDEFMNLMGFPPDTQFTVVRHNDTAYDHVHIIASRISLSARLWHGQWEARRAIESTQELERTHGLTLTPGLGAAKTERKGLTRGEEGMARRTGVKPPKVVIQEALDEVLGLGSMTATDFVRALDVHGVRAVPNVASTGKMNGFSFVYDGIPFSGSALGSNGMYAWKRLQDKGVNYDFSRDFEELADIQRVARERANARSADAGISPDDGADRTGLGRPARRRGGRDDSEFGTIESVEFDRGSDVADAQSDAFRAASEPRQIDHAKLDQGCRPTGKGSERNALSSLAAGGRADSGWGRGFDAGGDWSSRIKSTNTAKQRAAERSVGGAGVEQGHSERASSAGSDSQSALAVVRLDVESGYLALRDCEYDQTRYVLDEEEGIVHYPDPYL